MSGQAQGGVVLHETNGRMIMVTNGDPDPDSWNGAVMDARDAGYRPFSDDPDIEVEDVCVWFLERVSGG